MCGKFILLEVARLSEAGVHASGMRLGEADGVCDSAGWGELGIHVGSMLGQGWWSCHGGQLG